YFVQLRIAKVKQTTTNGIDSTYDTLGHSVGDELLKAVAERLGVRLRAGDIVARPALDESTIHIARLGGDEFTVVLPDIEDIQVVTVVAERVQRAVAAVQDWQRGHHRHVEHRHRHLSQPWRRRGRAAQVCRHGDVSRQGPGAEQLAALQQEADHQGRDAADDGEGLRQGLGGGDFRLYYQPQVAAEDGSLTGMEALQHGCTPIAAWCSPGEFIPLAEDSGLIVPLDRLSVLARRCLRRPAPCAPTPGIAGAAGVGQPGRPRRLPARSAAAPTSVDGAASAQSMASAARHGWTLELTESLLMDPDAQLRRCGGCTGSREPRRPAVASTTSAPAISSLAYLKLFPGRNAQDRPAASSSTAWPGSAADAATTARSIVAPGPASLDLAGHRRGRGDGGSAGLPACRTRCGKLQGYLFSPPVPPQAMEALLRQGRIAVEGWNPRLAWHRHHDCRPVSGDSETAR
ncbi:MAG: diguanylate cyclase, partial [Comamonadaceae bacterium]|nr:diguanylate cyclase [Comamonadaceae bacterium]